MLNDMFAKWYRKILKHSIRPRRNREQFVERLEDRVLLAYVQVLTFPMVSLTGDAVITDQSRLGGTSEDAGSLFQLALSAGQGPSFPEIPDGGRWGKSEGQFDLQGNYSFKIQADEGDIVGTPVKVGLHNLFSASGGTGARSSNPAGHTDVAYEVSITRTGSAANPLDILFSGQKSAELIDQSPTDQITDFDISLNADRIIEAAIGDTIRIAINVTGAAATWQGGSTGLARGAVTASVSFRVSMDDLKPELELSAAANLNAQRVDVAYSFNAGAFGSSRNSTLDAYWESSSGQRIGAPFYSVPLALKRRETGVVAVPLSIFDVTRPPGAVGVKFVAADPTDPSKTLHEQNDQNNSASISLFADPTVDLVFRPGKSDAATSGNLASGLHEKETFQVYAIVRNNSLVPAIFSVNVERGTIANAPPGLTSNPLTGTETFVISALDVSDLVLLGGQNFDWDWIPPENPMSFAKFGEAQIDEGKDFLIGQLPLGVGTTYSIYDTYKDVIKPYVDLRSELTDFPADVYTQIQIEYTAHVSSTASSGTFHYPERVDISVPQLRQAKLRSFYVLRATATSGVAGGTGLILDAAADGSVRKLAVGATAELIGMATWRGANRDYEAAKDPPDSNFTQLATVQPIEPSFISGITDAPILAIARGSVLVSALQEAQQLSRDRADGARDADVPTWEATQLLAASGFANQRTLELMKQGVLLQLLSEYYAGPDFDVPADAAQQIAQNGIPQSVQTIMLEFGYTAADIQELRTYFGTHGIQEQDPLEQWGQTLTRLLEAGISAMSELESALAIRTSRLGQVIVPISSGDLIRFDQLRTNLFEDFNPGRLATADLPDRIASFVDEVRGLALTTNNYAELKPFLDFGYRAFARYLDNDWRTQSLISKISQYEASGDVTPALAGNLKSFMNSAHQSLEAGLFTDAANHFHSAFSLVAANWENGITSTAGYPLAGAFSQAAGLLATGTARRLPSLGLDSAEVVDGVTQSINVLLNDTQATAGQPRILGVDPAFTGTAAVDRHNTPGNFADDTVVYTSGATFTGLDQVHYYVIDSGATAISRGDIAITRALTPGILNTRTVGISSQSYTFQAEGEAWYQLDTTSLTGSLKYKVTAPDGQVTFDSGASTSFRTVFRTSVAGAYDVELIHSGQGTATVSFKLVDLSDIPELANGQSTSGTLTPPVNGQSRSEVFYRLRVSEGEAVTLVTPDTNPDGSDFSFGVRVYRIDGGWNGYLDAFLKRLPLTPDQTTEYLVVAENRLDTPLTAPVSYEITVLAPPVEHHTISFGEVVTGSLNALGELHYYTFEGVAGQQVLIDSGTSGTVEVFLPDGISNFAVDGPDILPQSGQYVIRIRGGLTPANYRVRLVDLSSQPTLSVGTTATHSFTRPATWAEPDDRLYRVFLTAGQRVVLDPLEPAFPGSSYATWVLYSPSGDAVAF